MTSFVAGFRATAAWAALGLGLLKIGCAAAPPACQVTPPGGPLGGRPHVVLFALTAADEQRLASGKTRATGLFLGEFYEAYRAVREAGFAVAFATPEGRVPAIDPESLHPSYWKEHPGWLAEARSLVATAEPLRHPIDLSEALAREAEWAGLVVPGGQGVMVDLLQNQGLQSLIVRLGETDRPVGLICHAPALLARLPPEATALQGRVVTSVSGLEEFFIETFIMGSQATDRSIGAQLERRGFRHLTAFAGQPFALRDCNLVTSQNPYSGGAFREQYLAALDDWRQGKQCRCPGSVLLPGVH